MKAIQGQFKDGQIYLKERAPDCEQAEVLVIFPDAPLPERTLSEDPEATFTDLFGAWKDWWNDDMDALMRQAFAGRPDAAL